MENFSQDNEAVAAIGGTVAASGAQGLSTAAAAAAALTGLAPAGADEVSAQAATAFAAEGTQMTGLIEAAQQEIARAGVAFTGIAATFAATDAAEGERLNKAGDAIDTSTQ